MKTNVEKLEKSMIAVEVEVEVEKVKIAFDKAYRQLAKKVNIPGFRKGKAPKNIIQSYYGKEVVYEDVAHDLIETTYPEVVNQEALDVVDKPDVEVIKIEENEPFVYKVKVAVRPDVKLGNYKEITVEKREVEVTDEDVAEQLERMRDVHAELIAVEEGEIQQEDHVFIDFKGYIDDEAFEGGEGSNYELKVGSKTFIPGFEEQLIGIKTGEEKDIVVTFPEDYHAEQYAGKEATFHVKINEVKRKELAPLDDDFAKEVTDFDTLDELKVDLKGKMEEAEVEKVNKEQKDQFAKEVLAQAEVEIPDAMINARTEEMIDTFGQQLEQQGTALDGYLEYTKTTRDDLKENFRETAIESVKHDLVFTAIAEEEKIEIDKERLEEEIEKLAKAYQKDKEEMRMMLAQTGGITFIVQDLLIEKTLDMLLGNNNNNNEDNKEEQPQA